MFRLDTGHGLLSEYLHCFRMAPTPNRVVCNKQDASFPPLLGSALFCVEETDRYWEAKVLWSL